MIKNIITGLILSVLLMGCRGDSNFSKTKTNGTIFNDGSFKKEFSDGNYQFQIKYNDKLDSSFFHVLYKGKKMNRYNYKGKITRHYLVDLNKDRKNEVYLVVINEDVADLKGFRLDKDRLVNIEKGPRRKSRSSIIASTVNLERNQFIERFTYLSKEGNKENGESRYNMVQRDDNFLLLPQGWSTSEIEDLLGEYTTKIDESTNHYKVMLIGERNGGKWHVDIKVKRSGDKKMLCHFSGLGEMVDKDLFVPLSQANSEMKGTLQIRFLDGLAVVYTEDFADYEEMASICENDFSIAGNFIKIEIDE